MFSDSNGMNEYGIGSIFYHGVFLVNILHKKYGQLGNDENLLCEPINLI